MDFHLAAAGRAVGLSKVKAPAILHWDLSHYVVLQSVTSRSVVIHDPAIGVRKLPLGEVSKHFTGVVLELSPGGISASSMRARRSGCRACGRR